MKKRIGLKEIGLVVIFSIIVLFVMTGGNPNIFLIDDNLTQFYPVTQSAFEALINQGKIPTFDFYLQKGMITAAQGRYAQTNILMWIACFFDEIIPNCNSYSIYTFMAISIGNVFYYILLHELKISRWISSCCIAMLTCSSAFITFGYWYYIFENYLIIPLLLLTILYAWREPERKVSFWQSGLVLAFSVTLGNIQYGFYHFMLYGLILLILAVLERRFIFIKQLICNIGVAVLVSSPCLMSLMNASANIHIYNKDAFLNFSNPVGKQLVFSVVPEIIVYWLNEFVPGDFIAFMKDGSFNASGYGYFFTGFLGVAALSYGIICIQEIRKERKNRADEKYSNLFLIAIFCGMCFFIIFGLGRDFFIAWILSKMPVIKSFRYLFKTMFIYIPLFPVLAAYAIEYIKIKRQYILPILWCFVLIGACNNIFITTSGTHLHYAKNLHNDLKEGTEKIRKELVAKDIDIENYRMLSFLENSNGTELWNHYSAEIGITRNYPIMLGVYTLGGFDNSFDDTTFKQSKTLLSDSNFEFEIMNGVASEQFFERNRDDDAYIADINNNAVKYFVFEKESKYLAEFKKLIDESLVLEIDSAIEFMDDKVILELKNIPSLAQNDNWQKVELEGSANNIRVKLNEMETKNIRLAFTFYDQIHAGYYFEDTFYELSVKADEQGYIVIEGIDLIPDSVREINVFYQNRLFDFMYIESLLLGMAALAIMSYFVIRVQKTVGEDRNEG